MKNESLDTFRNVFSDLFDTNFILDKEDLPNLLQYDEDLIYSLMRCDERASLFAQGTVMLRHEVLLTALKHISFNTILSQLRHDKFVTKARITTILNNRKIMKSACIKDGTLLRHGSPRIQSDSVVVMAAATQDVMALKYASPDLLDDRELVLQLCQINGMALKYASDALRGDCELVLAACKQNVLSLAYASVVLRDDSDFVMNDVVMAAKSLPVQGNPEWLILDLVVCE